MINANCRDSFPAEIDNCFQPCSLTRKLHSHLGCWFSSSLESTDHLQPHCIWAAECTVMTLIVDSMIWSAGLAESRVAQNIEMLKVASHSVKNRAPERQHIVHTLAQKIRLPSVPAKFTFLFLLVLDFWSNFLYWPISLIIFLSWVWISYHSDGINNESLKQTCRGTHLWPLLTTTDPLVTFSACVHGSGSAALANA